MVIKNQHLMSRISSLEILDDTFNPREFDAKALGAWDYIEKRSIKIKLLVHESLRDRMVESCGEENIESFGNYKLIEDFLFVEDELGYNLLLSFGDKFILVKVNSIHGQPQKRMFREKRKST